MGTRATITVADDSDRFHIYQHYDGYPNGEHGMVRRLAMAPRMAWKLPRFEAMDFAAAVISVLKEGGGTTYLTKDAGLHSDRAFHYKITPLRDGVSTRVGLCITETAWLPNTPDKVLFDGDIMDAVQKFDAIAPLPEHPREVQFLNPIETALNRASEEISQWCRDHPEDDTVEVLELLENASTSLLNLRDQLNKTAPWDALELAQIALSTDLNGDKIPINRAKVQVNLAMDAHKRFQRD